MLRRRLSAYRSGGDLEPKHSEDKPRCAAHRSHPAEDHGTEGPFAGLAPEFAGLYQVNVIVPSGVAQGPRVPVVITVADQQSVPATMAVR